jgi:hypothetical protein
MLRYLSSDVSPNTSKWETTLSLFRVFSNLMKTTIRNLTFTYVYCCHTIKLSHGKNVCKINLHNGIYLQHYQHKVTLRLERDH